MATSASTEGLRRNGLLIIGHRPVMKWALRAGQVQVLGPSVSMLARNHLQIVMNITGHRACVANNGGSADSRERPSGYHRANGDPASSRDRIRGFGSAPDHDHAGSGQR